MTDEQIVRALAEKVMGWEFLQVGYFGAHDEPNPETPRQVELKEWLDKVDICDVGDYFVDVASDFWKDDWNPLTSDADACAVMKELAGFHPLVSYCDTICCWFAQFANVNHDAKAVVEGIENFGRTICIAALKAVGALENQPPRITRPRIFAESADAAVMLINAGFDVMVPPSIWDEAVSALKEVGYERFQEK